MPDLRYFVRDRHSRPGKSGRERQLSTVQLGMFSSTKIFMPSRPALKA